MNYQKNYSKMLSIFRAKIATRMTAIMVVATQWWIRKPTIIPCCSAVLFMACAPQSWLGLYCAKALSDMESPRKIKINLISQCCI